MIDPFQIRDALGPEAMRKLVDKVSVAIRDGLLLVLWSNLEHLLATFSQLLGGVQNTADRDWGSNDLVVEGQGVGDSGQSVNGQTRSEGVSNNHVTDRTTSSLKYI